MKKQWIAVLMLLAAATTLIGQTAEKKTLTLDGAVRVIAAAKQKLKKYKLLAE